MSYQVLNESDACDFIQHWVMDIGTAAMPYKEPILNKNSVWLIMQICDILDQNTNVFVLAVEIIEDYIRAENKHNKLIANPLLATVVAVFMAHKCDGAQEGLKLNHVVDLLYHLTDQYYQQDEIVGMERLIIMTLDGRLPIRSTVDDLWIIAEKYIREGIIGSNIKPLCLKMLEFLYVERIVWFDKLRYWYSVDEECFGVFRKLVSSKFFLPVCVLITAIRITDYQDKVDVRFIIKDISQYTKIHGDHIIIFTDIIMNIIQEAS